MKLRIGKCRVGISKQQPAIMFSMDGYEYERAKQYDGKDLTGYVIDIYKPKRSNQANSYMWELITQIEDRSGINRNDIYKMAVREAGVWYDGEISTKDFPDFVEDWEKQWVGWFVDTDIRGTKATSFRAYRGSSVYNSKQMSRLIDHVVEEAKFWNIETATPEELAKIKVLWGE